MIDTSVLVDNLVAMLRDIPELVEEMGGDPERIYAYHDQYPKKVSLAHAIHQMPAPSIMAVWQGTGARLVRRLRRVEASGHAVPAGARDVRRRPADSLLPDVPVDHEGRPDRERAWRC